MRRAALLVLLAACGGGPSRSPATSVAVAPVAAAAPVAATPASPPPEAAVPRVELAIAMGRVCLRVDGSVYCTHDVFGAPLVTEANAVPGIDDARSVALGQSFACAATRSGKVRCWGSNTFGELGAGVPADRSETPLEVKGVSGARRVVAGPWHACAILEDASVRCWGRNERGQTGSDTVYAEAARELVTATEVTGVKATTLALSYGTSCARTTAGDITCWGARDDRGYLGTGPMNQRPTPVEGLAGAADVSAGESGACAVQGGKIACWGSSLGLLPRVSDGLAFAPDITTARRLAVAGDHACALLTDGRVACFGMPYSGALGEKADENTYEAVDHAIVVDGLPRANAVAVGSGLSCALTTGDDVWCWGRSYATNERRDEPKPVPIKLR